MFVKWQWKDFIFYNLIQPGMRHAGIVLLEFRARVSSDPSGAFSNWNPSDNNPCLWLGVHCVAGKVQIL